MALASSIMTCLLCILATAVDAGTLRIQDVTTQTNNAIVTVDLIKACNPVRAFGLQVFYDASHLQFRHVIWNPTLIAHPKRCPVVDRHDFGRSYVNVSCFVEDTDKHILLHFQPQYAVYRYGSYPTSAPEIPRGTTDWFLRVHFTVLTRPHTSPIRVEGVDDLGGWQRISGTVSTFRPPRSLHER